jgi:hypothetical protein
MGLSCECGIGDGDYAWYYSPKKEQTPLTTSKRRRCQSCNCLIDVGSLCLEFERWKEICDTYGDPLRDEYLASHYECEECSDLRENLEELGFCVDLGDNIRDLTKEYAKMNKSGT